MSATKEEVMAFTTLDDETGIIECVLFPQAFQAAGATLDAGTPVRVYGQVQVDFGVRTLAIERAEALDFCDALL